MLKEALLYKKLPEKKVSCYLCSHRCLISDGKFGICQVRQNKGGVLYTYTYGEVAAANIDPIEKKPLFHVLPGSSSFSIAAAGCNFRCGFCQNWQISQKRESDKPEGDGAASDSRSHKPEGDGAASDSRSHKLAVGSKPMSPQEIVTNAIRYKCKSVSYTYTEPTIFFEYAFETAKLAKTKGLYNVFVTNGYMTKEALEMFQPYLDAANVDLKFFNDQSYRRICGAKLRPVLDSIALMRKLNIWVEVTTLVVPGENDSTEELKGIALFLAATGKEIPWHISRFHPDYKMTDKAPTALSKLKEAEQLGKDAGLRYVYIGNVIEEEKTYCFKCARSLISRLGFEVVENNLKNGKCPDCGMALDGLAL